MNENNSATSLSGGRLFLARTVWIFIFLLCSGMLLASLPFISRLTEREYLVITSYPLVSGLITYKSYVFYIVVMRYFALAIFLAGSLIIFWRKPRDWLALLASATLVSAPTAFFFTSEYPVYSAPLHSLLGDIRGLITIFAIVCLILFFNLFPDGKFALRGISAWVTLAVVVLTTLMLSMRFLSDYAWLIFVVVFAIVMLISAYAQVSRYRHLTSPTQRQQIKWVLFAFSFTAVGFLGIIFLGLFQLRGAEATINFIILHIQLLILTSIPVSIIVSIFRYRLWDIDVIIRRTLVYGSLSATLLAIYLISVVFFQNTIAALGGLQSEAGIAISTLLIAALFNPLRRRIQHDIDLRFYRPKYDTGQALARFTDVAREETNLNRLESALVQVVQETIQPESISLWMRDSGE